MHSVPPPSLPVLLAPASVRDALESVAQDDDVRREVHGAVLEALKGRGASRRNAERLLLLHPDVAPVRVIPLVLAVRDALAREESPPRGLSGRVDRILLAIAQARRSPRAPSARAGRLLRGMLDLSPDAVFTLRAVGDGGEREIGVWNRAAMELTGRRRREIALAGAQTIFERDTDLDDIVKALDAHGTYGPHELRIALPSGEAIPVRVFGARLGGAEASAGVQEPYLISLHDLTEVHRIRSRLIETEKLSAMAKIAGSVAHEFRNPLNSLFLSTDLLEDELDGSGAPAEAIAPTLTAIREEIERLNQIINNYLSLSKVASHVPEALDLGEMVKVFAEEWQGAAVEHGVELRVRVHEGDLAVSADPNQVRRILVNLVDNAFDALEDASDGDDKTSGDDAKGRGPVVTLAVRPLSRSVKLVVKDNGPGIPDEVRDRVFEPFFTSKSRGSGLGLYLVREMVLSHGGAITLASTGGRGTSVAMHWPRSEETPA